MGSYLDIVRRHTGLIQEQRQSAEANFRMSDEVMEALGPAGVFRVLAPDRHDQITLTEMAGIWEELGYGDPSVSWAAMNSNAACRFFAKIEPELWRPYLTDEVRFVGVGLPPSGFADLNGPAPESGRGAEQATISGRWPVVSGCEHADLLLMNCIHRRDGEMVWEGEIPMMGFALLPASAGSVDRTWESVMAVRGSGSHAVTIEPVTVSTDLIAGISKTDLVTTPWTGLPNFTIQSIALAAVASGLTRAAVDAAIAQASSRRSAANGSAWADYPSVQNTVASSDIAAAGLRSALFDLCEELWSEMVDGELASAHLHARCHSLADHSLRVGRSTISDLFSVGSVDAIRSGHILEQCLRDIHGFSVHWERYRSLHYDAGRALLGVTPTDPRY